MALTHIFKLIIIIHCALFHQLLKKRKKNVAQVMMGGSFIWLHISLYFNTQLIDIQANLVKRPDIITIKEQNLNI